MSIVPVPSPPLTPPRYSLLTTARTVGADSWPDGWEDRITWEPECLDPDAAPALDRCGDYGSQPGAIAGPRDRPVVSAVRLSATDECSTLGSSDRDWQGRARRLLAATESAQLARQLWAGAATAPATDPADETPYFDDGDTVDIGSTATDLVGVIADLEAEAATTLSGRPWLHLPLRLFGRFLAAADGMVQVQGGTATTIYGSVIVTDAGYPDTLDGADGDFSVVATGPLAVALSDVTVRGLDGSGVTREVNSRTVYAERYAAVQFEGCGFLSASVNL